LVRIIPIYLKESPELFEHRGRRWEGKGQGGGEVGGIGGVGEGEKGEVGATGGEVGEKGILRFSLRVPYMYSTYSRYCEWTIQYSGLTSLPGLQMLT
jgi:hypothetical protein